MSKADDYLVLITRPTEKITVPQFGEVSVRGLTAAEYDRFDAASLKADDGYRMDTATLIRLGVVDDKGAQVFDDSHLPRLADLPAIVSRPLSSAILRLCGIGADLGKA